MTEVFSYKLTGVGWALATISNGKQTLQFRVSYLADPLDELLAGLVNLLTSKADKCSISFIDEPGEHVLEVEMSGSSLLSLNIFKHEEWQGMREVNVYGIPNEVSLMYSDKDTLHNFSKCIQEGILTLLEGCGGKDAYCEQWRYPFPQEKFELLGKLLERIDGV